MFPYVEKKRRVDEYGETIDVGMWLRKGKVLEEEAESDDVKDYRRKQAEEETRVGYIRVLDPHLLTCQAESCSRNTLQIRHLRG
jgi:hypothetical protein